MSDATNAASRPDLEISRREALKAGAVSVLGMTLTNSAIGGAPEETADSCILVWLRGGLCHIDSFDPKPGAPVEIRGSFDSIDTSVPGLRIGEHLPKLAARRHRFSVVHSVVPDNASHGIAEAELLSGRRYRPGPAHPTFGSVIGERFGARNGASPFYQVGDALDGRFGGGSPGILGECFGPKLLRSDLALGERCRTAVRLVERGVRFVSVTEAGWDTHEDNFGRLAEKLPTLDDGLAAILDGLQATGRLDSTLVVALTDFGRSPRINRTGGRDHWRDASFAFFAGGGIRPGRAVGATDEIGAKVTGTPVSPGDLTATIYRRMGVALETAWTTAEGRRMRLLEAGSPIADLA